MYEQVNAKKVLVDWWSKEEAEKHLDVPLNWLKTTIFSDFLTFE